MPTERFNIYHENRRTSVSIDRELCIYFAASRCFEKWDIDAKKDMSKFLQARMQFVKKEKERTLSNVASGILLNEITSSDKDLLNRVFSLRESITKDFFKTKMRL